MTVVRLILVQFFIVTIICFAQFSYEGPAEGYSLNSATVSTANVVHTSSMPQPDNSLFHKYEANLNDESKWDRSIFKPGSNYISPEEIKFRQGIQDSIIVINKFGGIEDLKKYVAPDPYIAVGPAHIVQVVNSRFRICDKDGNEVFTSYLSDWFEAFQFEYVIFDPKVIYDHFDKRWVMVWLCSLWEANESYILISVSDDENPEGIWFNWLTAGNVNGLTPSPDYADYDAVGFDSNALYIVTNQITWEGQPSNAKIRIIKKQQIYIDDNPGQIAYMDLWNFNFPGSTNPGLGIRPAIMRENADKYYLVSHSRENPANTFAVYELTDPVSNPKLSAYSLPVEEYSHPSYGVQPGSNSPKLINGGHYVRNEPTYQSGLLHTVHIVDGNYCSLRYLCFDVAERSVFRDIAFGDEGYYNSHPALAVNGKNDVIISFSKSSPEEYVASCFRVIPFSTGIPSQTVELHSGLSTYNFGTQNGLVRWGDYNGAWTDPTDPNSMWVISEYAESYNKWGIYVANVRYGSSDNSYSFALTKSIDFGLVDNGEQSEILIAKFTNLGKKEFKITNYELDNDEFQVKTEFPVTVETFDTVEIEISYTPQGYSISEGDLMLFTDEEPANEFKISLAGEGNGVAHKGFIYAVTGFQSELKGELYLIDNVTFDTEELGSSGFTSLSSLSVDPNSYGIFALNTNVFRPTSIVKVCSYDGSGYLWLTPDVKLKCMVFDELGDLYAFGNDNNYYSVDLNTGEVILVKENDLNITCMTYDRENHYIYAAATDDEYDDILFKISKTSGESELVGSIGIGTQINTFTYTGGGKCIGTFDKEDEFSTLIEIDLDNLTVKVLKEFQIKKITGLVYTFDGITGVSRENLEEQSPNTYILSYNYPNPFNPSTRIEYEVPVAQYTGYPADVFVPVSLVVYDILGSEISTLINRAQRPGKYSVEFDGSSLSSGTYFYKLSVGKLSDTRKMLLIR